MFLVQSYIFSVARVHLSLYEQRLLLKIVEHAQLACGGELIKKRMKALSTADFENVEIKVSVADILGSNSNHYEQVIKAARTLETRIMEYYSSERAEYFCTPIIYNCLVRKSSGIIRFFVARRVFDAILDFSRGFSRYDYEVALKCQSAYACRLYILLCAQTNRIVISMQKLREMFCLQDRYKLNADFIKRVIDPAKKQLDEMGVSSFEYDLVKENGKITSIGFKPIKRVPDSQVEASLQAKLSVSALVSHQLQLLLINDAHFTYRELAANKKLLHDFSLLPESLSIALDIINRAINKNKRKGWIINAMKYEVSKE